MIFALSRTGFPLDIRLSAFVPDVPKKISYRVLDAFTLATKARGYPCVVACVAS